MPLEVRIDRNACTGSTACVRRAPRSFSLDREGKSVATNPPGDPDDKLREAANACPSFAIEVREAAPTS